MCRPYKQHRCPGSPVRGAAAARRDAALEHFERAAKLAPVVREMFRRVQADRDIVLVDQRGTGKSHPLECESEDTDDSLAETAETTDQTLARLKTCLAKYDADLTQYTTTIAMDDLDDVRAFLGYERINVYGGSYGTRAALVYMRQHGDRVRGLLRPVPGPGR